MKTGRVKMYKFLFVRIMTYIKVIASLLFLAINTVFAAAPHPWQMNLQPPAGEIAEKAVHLHNLLLIITGGVVLFVLALLVYVCLRFRRSANPVPSKRTHNAAIEIIWTIVPVLILVVIAVPSFRLLYFMDKTKDTEMVIKVTGNQWYWNYEYPDEAISFDSTIIDEDDLAPDQPRLLSVDNPLVVPAGTRIKLLVTGNDVMHSFFVPSLAVQMYTIIGRINEAWIDVPSGTATYYGQCNQICGTNHSYMPIVIKALDKQDYQAWLVKAKEEFAEQTIEPKTVLASAK